MLAQLRPAPTVETTPIASNTPATIKILLALDVRNIIGIINVEGGFQYRRYRVQGLHETLFANAVGKREGPAQQVAEQLTRAGIFGVLNFAPVTLALPREVSINDVDLAVELEQLAFHIGSTVKM